MHATHAQRPEVIVTTIAWFWLVNAGTLLFIILCLLIAYPFVAAPIDAFLQPPLLPGTEPFAFLHQHRVAMFWSHLLGGGLALIASLALLRCRRWALIVVEAANLVAIAYTLALGAVYFWFWFSLLAIAPPDAFALTAATVSTLVILIGVGIVLMLGVPFVIVSWFLRRSDVRQATH